MIKKEKRKEEARRNFLILAKQLFLMLREQNGSRAASRLGGDTIRTDKRWWWLGLGWRQQTRKKWSHLKLPPSEE